MLRCTVRSFVLAGAILLAELPGISYANTTQVEACYASLKDDVLTMGNDCIRRSYEWNGGHLKAIALTDVQTGQSLALQDRRPDWALGKLTGKAVSGQWTQRVVEDAITRRHLRVEVTTVYDHIDVRRVFRVYPGCAVIGCDFYLRARDAGLSAFEPKDTVLQLLHLPGTHWYYRAIEFFDRTDRINNLVQETTALAYLSSTTLRGNILWGQSVAHDMAVFMVKEAPCSSVQLHYPEYDFQVSTREVRAVGMGIRTADLKPGQWVRTYSIATGVCPKSEPAFLKTLRSYQKQRRRHVPARDDMIMMNTWGDRNKDARVGEAFVNREVDACVRLGISHLQIDDGWQQGLSRNSAQSSGKLWDLWEDENWQPHTERFPNGFGPVVQHAKAQGVDLGLWFHPSNANDYAHWQRDADILINLYRNFDIRYFKIDGVKLPNKQSETNLRRFFDWIAEASDGRVVVNLDATADNRTGYHYFYEYGNVFLENRYTDFGRYYPYWTLRNLWMLSKYVPPETLQIEFLNKWRNAQRYDKDDPLAPQRVPFGYVFAVTMMAQPLAWFEGSSLPVEAFDAASVIKTYGRHQTSIHHGTILPIGAEPNGTAWTGFQSIVSDREGYLLVFREYNRQEQGSMVLYDLADKQIECIHLCGQGNNHAAQVDENGKVIFTLPSAHSFALYRYRVMH
jgi:alpha-galactosidase